MSEKSAPVSASPQISKAAKKIRKEYGIEEWHDSMGSDPIADIIQSAIDDNNLAWGRRIGEKDNQIRALQSALDAATAEVKKEDLGSETPATLKVVSEQTGIPDRRIEQIAKVWAQDDSLWTTQQDVEMNLCRFASVLLYEDEHWRVQGSEVPTQKAPTDSRRTKETATVLTPAAPSRKQEADAAAKQLWHRLAEVLESGGDSEDGIVVIESFLDAAARVEPTKKEGLWKLIHLGGEGIYATYGIDIGDGELPIFAGHKQPAETLVTAHNTSCAVKEQASGKNQKPDV